MLNSLYWIYKSCHWVLIFLIEYKLFIEKNIIECSFFMNKFCYIWLALHRKKTFCFNKFLLLIWTNLRTADNIYKQISFTPWCFVINNSTSILGHIYNIMGLVNILIHGIKIIKYVRFKLYAISPSLLQPYIIFFASK